MQQKTAWHTKHDSRQLTQPNWLKPGLVLLYTRTVANALTDKLLSLPVCVSCCQAAGRQVLVLFAGRLPAATVLHKWHHLTTLRLSGLAPDAGIAVCLCCLLTFVPHPDCCCAQHHSGHDVAPAPEGGLKPLLQRQQQR